MRGTTYKKSVGWDGQNAIIKYNWEDGSQNDHLSGSFLHFNIIKLPFPVCPFLQYLAFSALLYSPCGPTAQHGCWRSPPPGSGNVLRRACGSRSSQQAPSRPHWQSLCHHMWLCPFLQTVHSWMLTLQKQTSTRTKHLLSKLTLMSLLQWTSLGKQQQTYLIHPGAQGNV